MEPNRTLNLILDGAADGGVVIRYAGYAGGTIDRVIARELHRGLAKAIRVANAHVDPQETSTGNDDRAE